MWLVLLLVAGARPEKPGAWGLRWTAPAQGFQVASRGVPARPRARVVSIADVAAQLLSEVRHATPPRSRLRGAVMEEAPDADPERAAKVEKAIDAMVKFSSKYCKNTGTKFCADPSIPAYVIKGLSEHKVELGAPLCPCRAYVDKQAEAKDGYWNCPCVPMRERHDCHCMLFLTEDNEFVGEGQGITVEEVNKHTTGLTVLE